MKYSKILALGLGCAMLLGCQAGKQREQILSNQDRTQQELDKARAERAELLGGQAAAAERQMELLRLSKITVGTSDEILTITKGNSEALTKNSDTLDKTFREIYGVGIDLRSAIGETRVVKEVNNRLPLRVHSEMPGTSESEVTTKLPIGAVIFQSRKVRGNWWRGVILQEGEKTEVYFAGKYTAPLRDELMSDPEGGMEIGATRTD